MLPPLLRGHPRERRAGRTGSGLGADWERTGSCARSMLARRRCAARRARHGKGYPARHGKGYPARLPEEQEQLGDEHKELLQISGEPGM